MGTITKQWFEDHGEKVNDRQYKKEIKLPNNKKSKIIFQEQGDNTWVAYYEDENGKEGKTFNTVEEMTDLIASKRDH